jgi:hypothetical protein
MLTQGFKAAALVGLFSVVGCSSPAPAGGGTGGSSAMGGTGGTTGATGGSSAMGGTGGGTCDGKLAAQEANDYAFSSTFTISTLPVKPKTELTFDWSGLNIDFLTRPMDPKADINMVLLALWNVPQATLEMQLNDDTLDQESNLGAVMLYPTAGQTSGGLKDMTEFGNPIDYGQVLSFLDPTVYPPDAHSYTVVAYSGTNPKQGTRMLRVISMDSTSTNTSVTLDSNSAKVNFMADLHTLTPSYVPAGMAGITLDWKNLKKNGLGRDFVPTSITKIRVGKYSKSVADMEKGFLDLDGIADQLFEADVNIGTSFDLSMTTDKNGAAFTGIDATNTWIIALNCGDCQNPAPWYLTIMKPCGN